METVLFEGRVHVDHHLAHLQSGEGQPDYDEAFAGQENALLGAGVPGALTLSVGTAMGDIGLRAVLVPADPGEPGSRWDEVVEASFRPAGSQMWISEPMGGSSGEFALPVADYRVRLCARGIDEAWDGQVAPEEELRDHYELVFWPAAAAPDAVLRLTSVHQVAVHRARDPELAHADLVASWDGDLPSGSLATDHGWFTRLDRDLAEAMFAAGPLVQRQLAYWAVEASLREADVIDLDFVADGLRALCADERPRAPFTDPGWMYQTLEDHPRNPRRTVEVEGYEQDQGSQALFTLLGALHPDPLGAAIDGVSGLRRVLGDGRGPEAFARAAVELDRLVAEHGSEPLPDSRSSDAFGWSEPAAEFIVAGPDEGWFAPGQLLAGDDPAAQYLDPRSPTEQLSELAAGFPELVAAADALDAGRQRDVAFSVARYCCQISGLDGLYWVNDAFLAFGQSSSPEPWSNGTEGAWLMSNPRVHERTTLHDGVPVPAWPLALRAVRHAVGPDPRESLLLTIGAALRVAGDTRRDDVLQVVRHQLA